MGKPPIIQNAAMIGIASEKGASLGIMAIAVQDRIDVVSLDGTVVELAVAVRDRREGGASNVSKPLTHHKGQDCAVRKAAAA